MKMHQLEDPKFVHMANRIIVGTILLFVIIVAGLYTGVTYLEIYKDLSSAPTHQDLVAQEVSIVEQNYILENLDKLSVSEIEEESKLELLRTLIAQKDIDVTEKEEVLDSLR